MWQEHMMVWVPVYRNFAYETYITGLGKLQVSSIFARSVFLCFFPCEVEWVRVLCLCMSEEKEKLPNHISHVVVSYRYWARAEASLLPILPVGFDALGRDFDLMTLFGSCCIQEYDRKRGGARKNYGLYIALFTASLITAYNLIAQIFLCRIAYNHETDEYLIRVLLSQETAHLRMTCVDGLTRRKRT